MLGSTSADSQSERERHECNSSNIGGGSRQASDWVWRVQPRVRPVSRVLNDAAEGALVSEDLFSPNFRLPEHSLDRARDGRRQRKRRLRGDTSWLGLCPDNQTSGGNVLSVTTRR